MFVSFEFSSCKRVVRTTKSDRCLIRVISKSIQTPGNFFAERPFHEDYFESQIPKLLK